MAVPEPEETQMTDTTPGIDSGSQVQAAKDEAVERVQDLTATTAEHAGAVKDEAKGKALDVAHDVRRELESQGDVQAKRVASTLHDVGSQLNDMAANGQPGAVTEVTRQVADTTRQLASRLEEGGVQGVSDDLRRFARRQPGLFLATAGVAGFVLTRVLRNASTGQSPVASRTGPQFPTSGTPVNRGVPNRDALPTGTLQ
jgi:hypothetical protein